jgi:mRNA interferase RelE/StbE
VYALVFLGKAVRELKAVDRAYQRIIRAKLQILAKNPAVLKNNIKRLGRTAEGLYRLRVGTYRVIFKKDEHRLVILVIRIGHRKDVYQSIDEG